MVGRARIKDHWAEQRIFTIRRIVAGKSPVPGAFL